MKTDHGRKMAEASAISSKSGDAVGASLALDNFRQALRRLGAGVTIVATEDGEGRPWGLIMTAVMSLTFDPPSMLIAVNRSASALPALLERRCFSISLIGAGEEEMCTHFAAADAERRFVAEHWTRHWTGVPVYRRATAMIICDLDDVQTFGTHMIIRGLVSDATYSKGATEALVYLNGRFCTAQSGG